MRRKKIHSHHKPIQIQPPVRIGGIAPGGLR